MLMSLISYIQTNFQMRDCRSCSQEHISEQSSLLSDKKRSWWAFLKPWPLFATKHYTTDDEKEVLQMTFSKSWALQHHKNTSIMFLSFELRFDCDRLSSPFATISDVFSDWRQAMVVISAYQGNVLPLWHRLAQVDAIQFSLHYVP